MKLSQLMGQNKSLDVTLEPSETGEERIIKLVYSPSAFTPRLETEMSRLREEDGKVSESVVFMLDALIVSWDITGNEGEAFPPNKENLSLVPFDVLGPIIETITKEMVPNQETASS